MAGLQFAGPETTSSNSDTTRQSTKSQCAAPKRMTISKAKLSNRFRVRVRKSELPQPMRVTKSKPVNMFSKEGFALQRVQLEEANLRMARIESLLRKLKSAHRTKRARNAKLKPTNSKSSGRDPSLVLPSNPRSLTPSPSKSQLNTDTPKSIFRSEVQVPAQSPSNVEKRKTALKSSVEQLTSDFDQSFGIDIIDLFVGPSKRLFRAHKIVLCAKIPYFEKMFNGGFREAADMSASFPEDDADAFGLLLEWVYRGRFIPFSADKPLLCEDNSNSTLTLYRLYGLADKLCLQSLMDYTMTILLSHWEAHCMAPGLVGIKAGFDGSPSGSPMRLLMAKWLHMYYMVMIKIRQECKYTTEQLSTTIAHHPELAKLFLEVLVGDSWAFKWDRDRLVVWTFSYCEFHVHPEDKDKTCPYKKQK